MALSGIESNPKVVLCFNPQVPIAPVASVFAEKKCKVASLQLECPVAGPVSPQNEIAEMLASNTTLVSLELACLNFSPKKMGDALAQNKSLKILDINGGDLHRDAFKAEFDRFMNGLRRNHTLL